MECSNDDVTGWLMASSPEHDVDVGAAGDLAGEPLEGVRRPDRAPVLDREPAELQEVAAGVDEHVGRHRELRLEGGDDAVEGGGDHFGGGLGEDRADRRGVGADHVPGATKKKTLRLPLSSGSTDDKESG